MGRRPWPQWGFLQKRQFFLLKGVKMNTRKLLFALASLAILASPLLAAPTMEGFVQITLGTPYQMTILTDGLGYHAAGTVIPTFCLERDEFITNATYWAVIDTVAIAGGGVWQDGIIGGTIIPSPGFDPLDPKTAYLYTQYLANPGSYTSSQTQQLQNAIWYIEAESQSAPYATSFINAANNSGWTNLGTIQVANLYAFNANTGEYDVLAQSFVIPVVPAPSAILLAGIGTTLVGWLRRRKAV